MTNNQTGVIAQSEDGGARVLWAATPEMAWVIDRETGEVLSDQPRHVISYLRRGYWEDADDDLAEFVPPETITNHPSLKTSDSA